jgi:hypothetical protein
MIATAAARVPDETGTLSVVITRSPIAPLNGESRISSPQVSQSLGGHPLRVLAEADDWLRVRGLDDYEGWINRGYTSVLPPAEDGTPVRIDDEWLEERRVSLGCAVRGTDGIRRPLPLGALIDATQQVESGTALPYAELRRRFERDPRAIIKTALDRFEGTPYEWGGVSPWGADCSGFVQSVYRLHGVRLPRDASQQAGEGRDAGTSIDDAEAGDLLFFSEREDGKITHVGIALGESRMVHLGLGRGGYAVETLNADGDSYVAALAKRFQFARRVTT